MVDIDRVLEIVQADEMIGICTECGNEQPAEPDAHGYVCEACGARAVVGAEDLLLEFGI